MTGSRQAMRPWPPTISRAEDEYARSVGFASGAERREAIRRDDERKWRRERQRDAELAQAGIKREEPAHAASALGVTAREYTPDEMRAARIQLGLEQTETPPSAAGAG